MNYCMHVQLYVVHTTYSYKVMLVFLYVAHV